MKNIYFAIILLLVVLSSCTTVGFVEPMPLAGEELSEFPSEFVGEFLDSKTKDTIKVTKQSVYLGKEMDFIIGDEAKLKTYKDYYILSLKSDKKDENTWGVIPFKIENGNIIVYYIVMENDDKDKNKQLDFKNKKIEDLNSTTMVKTAYDRNNRVDYFIISPTDEEFEKLFEKGLFEKIYEFIPIK